MIKKIKIHVLKLLSSFHILILKFKGIKLGKKCFINKSPLVKKHKGSKIIFGNNVTLTSNVKHNPFVDHPVVLRTLTKDAIINIKDNCGMSGVTIVCANSITIGEHTIIGANTLIYDSDGHSYTPEKGWNTPRLQTGRPINIGEKCFIGTRCIILAGVTIGDRCVISAGSVVTQDVPSGYRAHGNPAMITPLPKALGGIADNIEKSLNSDGNEAMKTIDKFMSMIENSLELPFHPEISDTFKEYEDWDSLAFLTLTTLLKNEYDITLTSDDINNLTTWDDVYKYVCGCGR